MRKPISLTKGQQAANAPTPPRPISPGKPARPEMAAPQVTPIPRGMPQEMADRLGGMRPPVGGMRPQGPAPTGPMVPVRGGGMAPASVATMMKKGGKVKSKQTTKMASGGKTSSASKRADGCAVKGKTKGRMV